METERELTLGGECIMQYANDVLLAFTLEICMFLLTNVTQKNSRKIKF